MNFTEMMSSDMDTISPLSDILLPEDIWSKFQLDQELNSMLFPSFDNWNSDLFNCSPKCLIHHDCMWTGLCSSKEHNMDETKSLPSPVDNGLTPATKPPTPSSPQQQQQQSLLKPSLKTVVSPYTILPKMEIVTPQTPPMSDDEETKKPTTTLQILHDAIYENIIDDDSDLSDYFKEDIDILKNVFDGEDDDDDDDDEEEEEEDEEEEHEQDHEDELARLAQLKAFQFAAESDHSYHKGNFYTRTANLGIDTPSDSEEEIDVVSLGSSNVMKTSSGALPTNPSSRDRQKLQRTMHNRFPNGIKTILPLKKQQQTTSSIVVTSPSQYSSSSSSSSPVIIKRRTSTTPSTPSTTTTTTTNKRSRQYNKGPQKYKRRALCGHSSDSEPEPSEKRSLHNNMERQRRIDLRNLFDDLKTLVPEVNKKQRAAKVLILRGAAQYCRQLTNTSIGLNRQVDDLLRQQERLRARVSQLRRRLAAGR